MPEVVFRPASKMEIELLKNAQPSPIYMSFVCGICGEPNNGRVVADCPASDSRHVYWCVCSCPKTEPTVIVKRSQAMVSQAPEAREFRSDPRWPPDLIQLFDEGAAAFGSGAFTAASMVARKILMACACHEGADDGKAFTYYVDYVTDTVLTFPRAKTAIDQIRTIGNEANHSIQFVTADSAKRALEIVAYTLNAIYSLPSA